MASLGLSFLKAPVIVTVSKQPPSPDELFAVALQAVRFTGFAASFPDFGFNIQSPEQLKVAVDEMISTHIFFQFMTGINSAERRYQLVDSHSEVDRSLGASCVRFDAKVEARGIVLAPPGVVTMLNSNNLICAHPEPASPKSRLIWISFVEAYREGDQPAADSVRHEVEPFLGSLQFMPPS